MKTAILVDGGYYRKRAQKLFGTKNAIERADELFAYCMEHLKDNHIKKELYRVFYYDCPPIEAQIYHPLLKKPVYLKYTELYKWTNTFFKELRQKRKFALRLGRLADSRAHYNLRPDITKKLCSGKLQISDLKEEDFSLNITQKGVDMKIGIDISSMAFKQQVEQIILIAGDSDFVPVAKLARREGIDFILDPMGNRIADDLEEHIDGIRSCTWKFQLSPDTQTTFPKIFT